MRLFTEISCTLFLHDVKYKNRYYMFWRYTHWGKENVKNYLRENPELRDELEYKIREHFDILNGMKKPTSKKKKENVVINPETGEVIEEK